jgi:AraC-like DNA-binding protein
MPPGELYWLCLRAPQRSDDFLGLSNEETGLLREALFEHSGRTFRVTKNLAVPFRALVDAYPVRDAAALLSARAALLQILEIVAEASRSPKGRRVSPRIERAVALMAEHLESPWHVTALAREVGYSPTHFAREFRARMGTSAKDYYARCRILAACRELMAAHASVTSLAHKLGFASSQHFATAFKRVTGLTPTEYHAACTARSSDESFPA